MEQDYVFLNISIGAWIKHFNKMFQNLQYNDQMGLYCSLEITAESCERTGHENNNDGDDPGARPCL